MYEDCDNAEKKKLLLILNKNYISRQGTQKRKMGERPHRDMEE